MDEMSPAELTRRVVNLERTYVSREQFSLIQELASQRFGAVEEDIARVVEAQEIQAGQKDRKRERLMNSVFLPACATFMAGAAVTVITAFLTGAIHP